MPEVNWTNSAGGDWSDASDWSTDTVPTFSDDVLIVEGSPTVVTISGADEAATLTFNTAEGELVENAGSLSVVGELHVESGWCRSMRRTQSEPSRWTVVSSRSATPAGSEPG